MALDSMDTELFDLCKQVYKRTGWKPKSNKRFEWYTDVSGHVQINQVTGSDYMPPSEHVVPLYTSDYLLEKLPNNLYKKDYLPRQDLSLTLQANDGDWEAHYQNPSNGGIGFCYKIADTPLKALLKLTIALSEAGELGNE